MSENSLLFWIFMFFVLFYIYFDMRINKLKKELLIHYNIFEELLQQGLVQQKNGTFTLSGKKQRNKIKKTKCESSHKEEFKVINPNFVNSFTPTEEETQNGLENIKQLKGIEWFNGFNQDSYATVDFS